MQFKISKLELNDEQLQKIAQAQKEKLELKVDLDLMLFIVKESLEFWNEKMLEINSQGEEIEFKKIKRVVTTFADEKLAESLKNQYSMQLENEKLVRVIDHLFMFFESLNFGDLNFEKRYNLIVNRV